MNQQPYLLRKAREGEEAATPGQPVAQARLWMFPYGDSLSRITGCHWLAAIIWLSQELSRFAEPTFVEVVATRNTKDVWCCEETVEDETSLWKAEEK